MSQIVRQMWDGETVRQRILREEAEDRSRGLDARNDEKHASWGMWDRLDDTTFATVTNSIYDAIVSDDPWSPAVSLTKAPF